MTYKCINRNTTSIVPAGNKTSTLDPFFCIIASPTLLSKTHKMEERTAVSSDIYALSPNNELFARPSKSSSKVLEIWNVETGEFESEFESAQALFEQAADAEKQGDNEKAAGLYDEAAEGFLASVDVAIQAREDAVAAMAATDQAIADSEAAADEAVREASEDN